MSVSQRATQNNDLSIYGKERGNRYGTFRRNT